MSNDQNITPTKLLGNVKRGAVFVVSAPAGTGKTTLVKKIVDEFSCVKASISFTTRAPRSTEMQGIDYLFISREEFEKKIEQNEFIEYVTLYGDYYGTSKKHVEALQQEGKHVILVIDTQGALDLKKIMNVTLIFIMPPSLEALASRLRARKSEPEEVIEKRLNWAKKEIKDAAYYDYVIVNDDLTTAYEVLKSILIAKEHQVNN